MKTRRRAPRWWRCASEWARCKRQIWRETQLMLGDKTDKSLIHKSAILASQPLECQFISARLSSAFIVLLFQLHSLQFCQSASPLPLVPHAFPNSHLYFMLGYFPKLHENLSGRCVYAFATCFSCHVHKLKHFPQFLLYSMTIVSRRRHVKTKVEIFRHFHSFSFLPLVTLPNERRKRESTTTAA